MVIAAIAAWWLIAHLRSASSEASDARPTEVQRAAQRAATPGLPEAMARAKVRGARGPFATPADGGVTIAGRVIDLADQRPVGNVEVVFRTGSGETATTTDADGAYAIQVEPGMYHAFVRDDSVLSVGRTDAIRIPDQPSSDAAGVPDESLMASVLATTSTAGVDLPVVRGGIVTGRVIDRGGRAIPGAVLRAQGGRFRPALGTDVVEAGRDGSFELRLAAGMYVLDVGHPRYAGIEDIAGASKAGVVVRAGDHLRTTITLGAGCTITGRVVRPDGSPAGEGAIERRWGETDNQFSPDGRITADGTFRYVTTDQAEVAIRAWPWKSAPSPSQRFTCRDGARYDGVVLRVIDQPPALAGTLVDAAGAPIALAYVDVQPLDPGGISQQERTDEAGAFGVYMLPPGRYHVVAQAEGGVTTADVTAPAAGLRLALGGTGRIEGATPHLPAGSFALELGSCTDGDRTIGLPTSERLVSVSGGRFVVDNLPACKLSFEIVWQGKQFVQHADVPAGGTAQLDLDFDALAAQPVEMPDPTAIHDPRNIGQPDDPNEPPDRADEPDDSAEPFVPDVQDKDGDGDGDEPEAAGVPGVNEANAVPEVAEGPANEANHPVHPTPRAGLPNEDDEPN